MDCFEQTSQPTTVGITLLSRDHIPCKGPIKLNMCIYIYILQPLVFPVIDNENSKNITRGVAIRTIELLADRC